ncbi:MAG: cobalamin biosynthesis protein CobW, partial [Leptolyngbya sp. SIO1D8]|nr:cobalamin biosynthesis protein CobW [Leptolyngbya sp. SIO1D8]
TDTERAQVMQWLQTESPKGVKIVPCDRGQMSPDVLLGFNAAVEDQLDSRPSHHDHEDDHDHDDDITSVPMTLEQSFDPTVLVNRLQALTQHQEIYRIKGFVNVPNKPMRLVLQGVGQRFETFFDRRWDPQERRQTRLIFIGKGLDTVAIHQALNLELAS